MRLQEFCAATPDAFDVCYLKHPRPTPVRVKLFKDTGGEVTCPRSFSAKAAGHWSCVSVLFSGYYRVNFYQEKDNARAE